jgi:uncharacterized protein YnzC (UPF0291/DUF896 family)
VSQVNTLQARRRAPVLPRAASESLMKINEGLPEEVYERYDELIEKRREGNLTEAEYKELLELTDLTEKENVDRIQYLAELAQLRNTTLPELMESLGIEPRTPRKTLKRKRS